MGIDDILIQLFPALLAGELFPAVHILAFPDIAAFFGDLRFDEIDVAAHIDAVGNGLLVGVFADHVLIEKAEGSIVGRGGEADQEGVEVVQHLFPEVVDAPVAFVDDDEVEELNGQFRVISYRHRLPFLPSCFAGVCLFGLFIQLFALEDGIEPLNGADIDLIVGGHKARFQAMDAVQLGKFAVVVIGHVGHEFLLGLFAEVFRIHQKKHPFGLGIGKEAINGRNGRKGLSRTGGHLDQGLGLVSAEGIFQVVDGADLAIPKSLRI